ncbi:P-loop containing nucleoside triphosphate hydrolase protein [Mycena pura]|uniref:P-loop containing nucleoside triphosphate hydrolase protein n=1 Tax=Mycena pura TaxID=153505 RepID=A0AAD6VNZ5_9AGAR|nr:P-loop containing nucleoside triphosphate hydrolase protein [Mycena pura]
MSLAPDHFTSLSSNSSSTSTPSADSGNDHGVGLSDPVISQARRRMLDLVNRLHSTGVQIDIDLPQIAVIGNQSAGKSSLIESISGITLPRAAGTCTRCPTECRLSRTDTPWQCVVELRVITDKNGRPLGPPRNEQFGDVIFDKSEVEDRIRRAQRAILNPSKTSKTFLKGDDNESPELSFSTNYISLHIYGPEVADLSFVDLPGLIASISKGGNERDIQMVENLVTSYISKPSCVILLTVACETDFENQGAHHLTKKHDPDGKRTIGMIPHGEEENWLPLIRNEQEPLENNWYCVKQPSSQDLKEGITWAEARSRENGFFSITAPWSGLDPIYQKYLRTSNLIDRLSSILSDLISKRLPQIKIELEATIQKTRDSLNKLPKPPSNDPLGDIAALLHSFVGELNKIIEGIPRADGLLQTIRPAQERFRREIRSTAPDFRPFERRGSSAFFPEPRFLANEDGDVKEVREDNFSEVSVSLPMSMPMEEAYSPVDSAPAVEYVHAPAPAVYAGSMPGPQAQTVYEVYESVARAPSPAVYAESVVAASEVSIKPADMAIFIDEVLERALAARTRELPGHYPFFVQKSFIAEFTAKWEAPAQALCRFVHTILLQHVKALVTDHFSSFGQGGLEQRVTWKCANVAQALIAKQMALEEDGPLTLNEHYLADYKAKFLSYYKGARERKQNPSLASAIEGYNRRLPEPVNRYSTNSTPLIGLAQVLSGLAAFGLSNVKSEDLVKLLPPDRMDPALNIMADVRAYFQVAYKRVTDDIPLAIDHELVRGVGKDLLATLYTGLGINGPDGQRICRELAQESPSIVGKREELLKRLERLETAGRELVHVGL